MKSGLWVNPGRRPTRIGGDGILPYLLVPHWVSSHVASFLQRHGVESEVREGFVRGQVDRVDPEDTDKFIFPHARTDFVQELVDAFDAPPRPGAGSQ